MEIDFSAAGFKQLEAFLNAFPKEMASLTRVALLDVTRKTQQELTRRYMTYNSQRPPGFGREASRRGKDQGHVKPPRPPIPESQAGYAPMAKNIIVKRIKNGFRVTIDPKAKMPHSTKPVKLIANYLEAPYPIAIPQTLRAFVYRKLIMQGKGGFGTKKTRRTIANNKVFETILYTGRRVPVWNDTFNYLVYGYLPNWLQRSIIRNIGQVARRHGGQVR